MIARGAEEMAYASPTRSPETVAIVVPDPDIAAERGYRGCGGIVELVRSLHRTGRDQSTGSRSAASCGVRRRATARKCDGPVATQCAQKFHAGMKKSAR